MNIRLIFSSLKSQIFKSAKCSYCQKSVPKGSNVCGRCWVKNSSGDVW